MSNKLYYFVDYENVHEPGLEGMNTLPKDSEVHLFYSQNANKLNLDLLRFVKAKLRVHRVKPGKQSLDMQMVSYLGYCIGEEEREGTFILVSKDTDYANTVLFWREEGVEVRVQPAILEEKNADGMERALRSVKVTRRGKRGGRKNAVSVQEAAPEPVKEEAPAPVKAEPAAAALPAEPVKEEAKTEPVQAPQAEEPVKEEKKPGRRGRRGGRGRKTQTESPEAEAAKTEAAEAKAKAAKPEPTKQVKPEAPDKKAVKSEAAKPAAAAKEAAKPAGKKEEPKAPAVQNKAVPDEPAKVTVTVHDVPMVTHAVPQAKPEKAPERSQTAARVQAALAEKKVDAAVARKLASIVQKHEGKKNSRQAIYLETRKTFGQKMGVDLYNSVKGLLK